jgi:hypothetical protein
MSKSRGIGKYLAILVVMGCEASAGEYATGSGAFDSMSCAIDTTWQIDFRRSVQSPHARAQTEMVAVAGLVVVANSVFVFDSGKPRIHELDHQDLTEKRAFAREGSGPGELARDVRHSRIRKKALANAGSHLAVLDERRGRLLAFNYDGTAPRLIQRSTTRLDASPIDGRLYARGDTVFMGGGYFSALSSGTGNEVLFSVVAAFRDSVWNVARMPMQTLPTARGAPMVGTAEAVPLWAIQGDCVYLNNGHDLMVTRTHRATGAIDSIKLKVPESIRIGAQFNREEYAKAGIADWPEPSLQRRVADLSVDPAGGIWLHLVPTGAAYDRAVVAYSPGGGVVEVDTMAFFPRAFGANGTLYGVTVDGLGIPWVVRGGASQRDVITRSH